MSGIGGVRALGRNVLCAAVVLGATGLAGTARAAAPEPEIPPPPAKPEKPTRLASITLSPLHLILPMFELTAELSVVPHFGVAILGGIGSVAIESNDPTIDGERFQAYEVGGQLLGYPLEPFQSLVVGAEVLWVHVSLDEDIGTSTRLTGSGQGVAVGPLIGYKYMARSGFTMFVHGGVQYMVAQAEADDGGGVEEEEDERFIPLLNLNLGWSF